MQFSIACNSMSIKHGDDDWIWNIVQVFLLKGNQGSTPHSSFVDWHRELFGATIFFHVMQLSCGLYAGR